MTAKAIAIFVSRAIQAFVVEIQRLSFEDQSRRVSQKCCLDRRFFRTKVAIECLTDQYPAILTSRLVINADIYLRFISIIAVSRAPSLPTNAGSSLSPVEKVTSNSITYIIGITVAVSLLVLTAVAFYCYWRKKIGMKETRLMTLKVMYFLRSNRQAERSLKRVCCQ